MITITAEVHETKRLSSEVKITLSDGSREYITFKASDTITMRHRDRATMYAREISGTRTLADTLLVLAKADQHYAPNRLSRLGTQFYGTLGEIESAKIEAEI